MGKVGYSPKALEDLQRIKAYIIDNLGVDVSQKAMDDSADSHGTMTEVSHNVKKGDFTILITA